MWGSLLGWDPDGTATLSVLGMRLGKSRVCEVGCKVLCQIYARRE